MTFGAAWTKSFPATVNGVIEAAQWIEALAAAQGFPDDLAFRIQICVEELFTNTVRHGAGGWPGNAPAPVRATPVMVSITIARDKGVATVTLEDNAPPFDVAAATCMPVNSPLEVAQTGGLGVLLIRNFSSNLTYDRADGLNRTTLHFQLPD